MKLFDINGLEDKYINFILNRLCHANKNIAKQTDFAFRFIPLVDFCLSDSTEIHEILYFCPIRAHAIVKSFQKLIYLGATLKLICS